MGLKLKVKLDGKYLVPTSYGDGVHWLRGPLLGKGGFGSVFLGQPRVPESRSFLPSSRFAVKTAEVSNSTSLMEERQVLASLFDCPNIIHCFGDEITTSEDGTTAYNLLLEYGSGGSLYERIYKSGQRGFPESEVRWYTRSILEGLMYIHEAGYVHCDLKPENILLVPEIRNGRKVYMAKICDFGLAKRMRRGEKRKPRVLERHWRGTPMYLAPESVKDGIQESPSDIWSLGCIVLEMLTGKRAWDVKDEESLLKKIGKNLAVPKIPKELSWEAKSFLNYCLRRMVKNRSSAKTLLRHPFVDVEV